MSFKRALERNTNGNMRAHATAGPSQEENANTDIKKHHNVSNEHFEEEEDAELSEKKEQPPRFSTVFTAAPPPAVIDHDPPRRRKSGVFIPMPLFILLAVILFLESTFLFAYTIIGLYNNRPYGLINFGPSPPAYGGSVCAERQAGVNIIMPGSQPTVTVTADNNNPDFQPVPPKTLQSKTTTSLAPTTPSVKIVTFTPKPTIATSNIFLTVAPDGSTISPSKKSAATSSAKKGV